MNSTPITPQDRPNWELYKAAEIFTMVFVSILAIATTMLNGFTMYVIYKDPLHCFRTPLTTFITGIIISDFFTGLLVEPAIAASHVIYYYHNTDKETYLAFVRATEGLAMVTMNTSFFLYLALAIAGLIAMGWPAIYDRHVNNNMAKVTIAVVWIYSIFFAVIPEMTKTSLKTHYIVDLILHSTLLTVGLVVTYAVTFIVFKTKVRRFVAENGEQPTAGQQLPRVEKDFLIGIFLLTILLLLTVWPFAISLYVWFFHVSGNWAKIIDDYIALIICLNIFLSKFLWDPAVLILRVPMYRKSMVILFNGMFAVNAAGIVAYNRHADEEWLEHTVQETVVVEGTVSRHKQLQDDTSQTSPDAEISV